MTKDVLIKISGLQAMDGESDDVEIITAGDYFQKNGKHYIIYEEAMEGFEGTIRNVIKVTPRKMDVLKSGVATAHMVFEQDQKALTRYVTPMGEMVVGFSTNRIQLEENENSLKVSVDYSLDINYDHISDCSIVLDVCSREGASLECGRCKGKPFCGIKKRISESSFVGILISVLCCVLKAGNYLSAFFSFFESCKETLLFRRQSRNSAADALHFSDVDAAYHYLGLGLYRKHLESTFISHQSHHLRSDLGFYYGNLCPAHVLGCLLVDHLGKSGVFDLHLLFVDDEHGYDLLGRFQKLLLLHLTLLQLSAEKIQYSQYNGGNYKNYQHNIEKSTHGVYLHRVQYVTGHTCFNSIAFFREKCKEKILDTLTGL